jgi:hypothetical protein
MFVPPYWKKEFQVYANASNFAIGSVLCQKDETSCDHLIHLQASNWWIQKITTLLQKEKLWG